LQANLQFEASESHSDALVPTVAECEVRVRPPLSAELVSVREHIVIAVGDIDYGHDDFALFDQTVAQLHVSGCDVRTSRRTTDRAAEPNPTQ
jgi:hypothetical protein